MTNALPRDDTGSPTPAVAGSPIRQYRGRNYRLKYHLATPADDCEGAPVLVAVHGVSRNAREQAEAFSRVATRCGFVVVAPYFSRNRFRAYQRLGLDRKGPVSKPVAALYEVLDEITTRTGADTSRVFLFGYSGGGQFAHRLAMRHPERVRGVVMGAPGWTTFPDPAIPFPRGLGDMPELRPERFLRVPALVLVGDRDNVRDPALNRSLQIDTQQGMHRIERGRRWVRSMQRAARLRGMPADFRFDLLPDCGHSFEECVRQGRLVQRAMEFFLEPSGSDIQDDATGWLVFSAGADSGTATVGS